jgi:hypothetical protein
MILIDSKYAGSEVAFYTGYLGEYMFSENTCNFGKSQFREIIRGESGSRLNASTIVFIVLVLVSVRWCLLATFRSCPFRLVL